ncbi:hypothetical protein GCM10007938_42700 [Vibrio zhanjiangensis]|uniref:DUF2927 domain-containing protein n=1 Tax=Vibrio zhanjiangensis TaxID=1046128 RepID=A0ABQ6F4M1_9VIBR|nr:hypothetical protein [Vibrio zhanjiangensis]GLT20485.1 hypothetical protein GCM10007938_42700 [Vibrio zhanjiangensis]
MKRLFSVVMTLFVSLPVWAHSPELTQLLDELNAQYNQTYTKGARERDKADVTKLPYFVMHVNEQDTPEKLKLESYLTGLHNGLYDSINMQKQLNVTSWFCMRDTMIMNPKRHPDFLKDLIWSTLEKVANQQQIDIKSENYIGAFGLSINSVVKYGLQTEYPCFKPIPKQVQLNGWKY